MINFLPKMKCFVMTCVFTINTLFTYGENFKRVCYFTNWSNKRPEAKWNFQLVDVDPTLCTHIIYAFAIIDTANTKLIQSEKDDDNGKIGTEKDGRYFDFTKLKKTQDNLVTLLSVGGARHSASFTNVSISDEKRRLFARNCVIFLRDRDFDGLDIDWEYPSIALKENFTLLLKAIREEFERESKSTNKKRMILTIAAGAGKNIINNSYNITEIVKYVDFINVMTYDYFGGWSEVTGWSGPLFSRLSDPKFDDTLSQDWTIHKWIKEGAPPNMLMLGTTGTGISFQLSDPEVNGVGSPVNGTSSLGSVLPNGQLTYFEVCSWLKQGATVKWDDEQKMNYAFRDNIWVGYESPRSLREKVKFARRIGLGGIMFWSFDLDDFYVNLCSSRRFPLLKTIKETTSNFSIISSTTITKSEKDLLTSQTLTKYSTAPTTLRTHTGDHIKVFIPGKGCVLRTNKSIIIVFSVIIIILCML